MGDTELTLSLDWLLISRKQRMRRRLRQKLKPISAICMKNQNSGVLGWIILRFPGLILRLHPY
ncbi:hypothetical protein BVC80_975g5 [Macleaya cordata]|uniref:Uncharacterized protein n=1 Tax=Macleaya cordata TaxID=56857 RepID=A0A200Q6N2_MACCD|nr:hypothetical protein BVC80_975g5 [Macleaya cordata]